MPPAKPLAFISDENYLALPDVAVELEREDGCVLITRSSAGGGIYGDVPTGDYRVTLAKPDFGAKRLDARIDPKNPLQFRLLSDAMYGYVWPKWSRSGDRAEFRVHSPAGYHLTLWRYGKQTELVRPIGWFDEHGPRATLQILPDSDFTQSGVGWNRRGYLKNILSNGECRVHGSDAQTCRMECRVASQIVEAPARSGLYFFHAETLAGEFLSFPWVVSPTRPAAKIAVLASTNTWNAYNNFGGRSNYINPTGLPSRPTINSRLDLGRYSPEIAGVWESRNDQYLPLSFDRPEPFNHIPCDVRISDPIRGRQACHLVETLWRLLGWLEREEFEYDLYSDHQLHCGELNLDAYQVLMLDSHPEYWSREAYFRVKKWVWERGGRLAYLGGNGTDCEIEYVNDAAMRCKTWQPRPRGSFQFTDPDTGREYDCRFHYTVESPAALLGVVFSEYGCGTSAPFRALDASHWIFAGMGLKDGDNFGHHSLQERCPGGASGHETDKRTAASVPNAMVLARGLNPDHGGAEIVCFDTPSGGGVFSAGSITWCACLLIDPQISRMTRNVLERFVRA